jgi:hypothetical protein
MENDKPVDDKLSENHISDEKQYLFDAPKNVKRLLNGFYVCCVVLVALDFVIHRHVLHNWENLWGFYPIYGFVGCVILVLVATWMRTFLMRDEDYYDPQENNTAPVNTAPVKKAPVSKEANNNEHAQMNRTDKEDRNVDA